MQVNKSTLLLIFPVTLLFSPVAHSQTSPMNPESVILQSIGQAERDELLQMQDFESNKVFQWFHWWEANRSTYLEAPNTGTLPVDPDQLTQEEKSAYFAREEQIKLAYTKQRQKAVDALMLATESEESFLRASACLALGRMRETNAFDRLVELTSDENVKVRRDALISLGLIGGDKSRDMLLKLNSDLKHIEDRIAWTVAVTMLDEINSEIYNILLQYINQTQSNALRRQAAFALRVINYPGTYKLMQEVLHESPDPYLAIEAILCLGRYDGEEETELLADIYLAKNDGRDLPVLQNIASFPRRQPPNFAMALGQVKQLNWSRTGLYYWRAVKSAAAIGLAQPGRYDEDGAANEVRHALANHYRVKKKEREKLVDFTVFPLYDVGGPKEVSRKPSHGFEQRFANIALGTIGSEDERDYLVKALNCEYHTWKSWRRPVRMKYSPARSHAAIALGLHLRKLYDQQINQARKFRSDRKRSQWNKWRGDQNKKYAALLARYVADRNEPLDFRAACTLALGLAGNRDNANLLLNAAGDIRDGEGIVLGYTILSLGMLGEEKAVKGADKFIGNHKGIRTCQVRDATQQDIKRLDFYSRRILARRAAVQGLGLIRSDSSAQLAITEFGYDYFVSQEVAWALRQCRNYQLTDELVQMLDIEDPIGKRAPILAARCLGELFDDGGYEKINRLLADCNYTLPTHITNPGYVLEEYLHLSVPIEDYQRIYRSDDLQKHTTFYNTFLFLPFQDPMFLYRSYANEYLYFHMLGRTGYEPYFH